MPPPTISAITPGSGRPNEDAHLSGTGFAPQQDGSRVVFRLRAPGAPEARAPVTDWKQARVSLKVPPLASLGSGGIADVTVLTSEGTSNAVSFTVLEPQPPVVNAIQASSGGAGTAISVLGGGFGLAPFGPGTGVFLSTPGRPEVALPPTFWSATEVRAVIPDPGSLAGPATLIVRTLWGSSAGQSLIVGGAPTITSVSPSVVFPGDVLMMNGTSFGPGGSPHNVATLTLADATQVSLPIQSWSRSEVRAVVPDTPGTRTAGAATISVTAEGGTATAPVELEGDPVLPDRPVVMFPVRMETRFAANAGEVLVRIFADDCCVNSHERDLTPAEAAAADDYAKAPSDTAWQRLVSRFGAARAAWIVKARSDPKIGRNRTGAWTRAPRTQLLPNRWFAFAYVEGQDDPVATGWGRRVPDELALGPDPAAPAGSGPTTVDDGMRWMIEFPEAERRGMGLRIALPPEAADGLARVVVVGVKTTLPAATTAAELLERCLEAHRYTGGLGFLPDGTPTNNSESAPSGFDSKAEEPAPAQPPDLPTGCFADETARALGLGASAAELFGGLPHASEGAEIEKCRRAMNIALWPATWGYFLDHLVTPIAGSTQPAIGTEAVRRGRSHFIDTVRASGPLPVLRVGNQPYGLLPVLPLSRWTAPPEPSPANPAAGEAELAGLVRFLLELRPAWRRSVAGVPRPGRPLQSDPEEPPEDSLLSALAMLPRSVSHRGRTVLGPAYVDAAWRFLGQELPSEWWTTQRTAPSQLLAALGVDWEPRLRGATFATNYFALPSVPVQKAAGPVLKPNYVRLLAGPPRPGYRAVRDEELPLGLTGERPILYLLLRHSLLVQYGFAAGELEPAAPWRAEPELTAIDEFDDAADSRPRITWDLFDDLRPEGGTKGDFLDTYQHGPNDSGALRELGELRTALGDLADLSPSLLEQLMNETLDLCSYRLDAWITSLARRRLATMGPSGGVHIGGYGFVEDLRPDPVGSRESLGYVHAPSPQHAAASAILASGHVAYGPGNGNNPFGIDLSSDRVRRALSLLDGVREGQPLGALLGYQFERGLHEHGLAWLIDEFRSFAPQPAVGAPVPGGPAESIATRNVVDGLALQRRWVTDKRALTDKWPGSDGPAGLTDALAALDDAVDALGDVLLAESVLQTVQGNQVRAAAALDAAAHPTGPPPELEFVRSPGSGVAVTHRLAVMMPGQLPPQAPLWPTDPQLEARAPAEPRLSAWADMLLGDPKRVRMRIEYRARDSAIDAPALATTELRLDQVVPALSALDVVHAPGPEIEQRIAYHALRSRPPDVPADATVRIRPSAQPEQEHKISLGDLLELAGALRDAIGHARPLTPGDVSLPAAEPTGSIAVGEIVERAKQALEGLQALSTRLSTAGEPTADAETIRSALLAASYFGLPGSIPTSASGDSEANRTDLRGQLSVVSAEVRRRLDEAPAPSGSGAPVGQVSENAQARLAAVFGAGFSVLPLMELAAGASFDPAFASSDALQGDDPLAAVLWFQRLTRVRDGAGRLATTLTLAEALDQRELLGFRVAQLPSHPGDRWVALPFGHEPVLPVGRVSIVAHLPLGALAPDQRMCGLSFEEVSEVLPSPERTTGVAFHFDQPNASAPQAIVIAVPPAIGMDWRLDTLRATVEETAELAKLRMVDLDALREVGHFLPATYFAMNSQGSTVGTNFAGGTGIPFDRPPA